jgi:hypothetical protein
VVCLFLTYKHELLNYIFVSTLPIWLYHDLWLWERSTKSWGIYIKHAIDGVVHYCHRKLRFYHCCCGVLCALAATHFSAWYVVVIFFCRKLILSYAWLSFVLHLL